MYRIALVLVIVLLMLVPTSVFAQSQCGGGGGFFSGGRASRASSGCGSGWVSSGGCGVSYDNNSCGASYDNNSCGVSYDNSCGVSYDNSCGENNGCAVDTSDEPKKAILDEPTKAAPAPDPPVPAPKHPTETTSTSFKTASFKKTTGDGSGYIVLENVSASAKVVINGHLTTQTGMRRVYKSINLSPDRHYRYRIVVGQQVVKVVMTSGDTKVVKVN